MSMTAQELIDVIVMHYNGAPDDEAVSIGHWHKPSWASPIEYFVPQIKLTVGELRGMATARAIVGAEQLRAMKQPSN